MSGLIVTLNCLNIMCINLMAECFTFIGLALATYNRTELKLNYKYTHTPPKKLL